MEEIELVKKFSEKFSQYATIKFTNGYWSALNFKFNQKSKNSKNFEISHKDSDEYIFFC